MVLSVIKKVLIQGFTLLLCVSGAGWAGDDNMVIKQGAYNSPPWVMQNGGKTQGVIPWYSAKVVDSSGKITIPIQAMSLSRGALELKKGGVDLVVAPFNSDFLQFADPLVSIGNVSLTLYSKAPFAPDSLDDLSGKRIAALRVLDVKKFFSKQPDIEWTQLVSEEGGVESVVKGYLDAIVCTEVGYKYAVESNNWSPDVLQASMPIGSAPPDCLGKKRPAE